MFSKELVLERTILEKVIKNLVGNTHKHTHVYKDNSGKANLFVLFSVLVFTVIMSIASYSLDYNHIDLIRQISLGKEKLKALEPEFLVYFSFICVSVILLFGILGVIYIDLKNSFYNTAKLKKVIHSAVIELEETQKYTESRIFEAEEASRANGSVIVNVANLKKVKSVNAALKSLIAHLKHKSSLRNEGALIDAHELLHKPISIDPESNRLYFVMASDGVPDFTHDKARFVVDSLLNTVRVIKIAA